MLEATFTFWADSIRKTGQPHLVDGYVKVNLQELTSGIHGSACLYSTQHYIPPLCPTKDLRILSHHPHLPSRLDSSGIHHALASCRYLDLPRYRIMGRRSFIPYPPSIHPQQTMDRRSFPNSRQSTFNRYPHSPHSIYTQDFVSNAFTPFIMVGRSTFLCRHARYG